MPDRQASGKSFDNKDAIARDTTSIIASGGDGTKENFFESLLEDSQLIC